MSVNYYQLGKSDIGDCEEEPEAKSEKEYGVLLLGPSQSGKSSLGNMLIRLSGSSFRFETGGFNESVTSEIQHVVIKLKGVEYRIIDTPGLDDTSISDDVIYRKLINLIETKLNIIHIFLIMNRSYTMNKKMLENFDTYLSLFGRKIEYITLIISNMTLDFLNELAEKGYSVNQYCSHVQSLVRRHLSITIRTMPINSRSLSNNIENDWIKNLLTLMSTINPPINSLTTIQVPKFLLPVQSQRKTELEKRIKSYKKSVDEIRNNNYKSKVAKNLKIHLNRSISKISRKIVVIGKCFKPIIKIDGRKVHVDDLHYETSFELKNSNLNPSVTIDDKPIEFKGDDINIDIVAEAEAKIPREVVDGVLIEMTDKLKIYNRIMSELTKDNMPIQRVKLFLLDEFNLDLIYNIFV